MLTTLAVTVESPETIEAEPATEFSETPDIEDACDAIEALPTAVLSATPETSEWSVCLIAPLESSTTVRTEAPTMVEICDSSVPDAVTVAKRRSFSYFCLIVVYLYNQGWTYPSSIPTGV